MNKRILSVILLVSSAAALHARMPHPFEVFDLIDDFTQVMMPMAPIPAAAFEVRHLDVEDAEANKTLEAIKPKIEKNDDGTVSITFDIEGVDTNSITVISTEDYPCSSINGAIPVNNVEVAEKKAEDGTVYVETVTHDGAVNFCITEASLEVTKRMEQTTKVLLAEQASCDEQKRADEETAEVETVATKSEAVGADEAESTEDEQELSAEPQYIVTSVSHSETTTSYTLPGRMDLTEARVTTKDGKMTITLDPRKPKKLHITHL